MALRQTCLHTDFLLLIVQRQKAQFVCQSRLSDSQPACTGFLRTVPKAKQIPQSTGLLKGVQLFPLQIFQKAQRCGLFVFKIINQSRNGTHRRHFAGTPEMCIRDSPYSKTGGIAILWGNIAKDGCVVKRSAVAPEMLVHSGPARV